MVRINVHGAVLLSAALIVLGLILIAVGGASMRGTSFIPTQLSYAVSGGLAGLALVGVGLGLWQAHVHRVTEAQIRVRWSRIIDETADLLDVIADTTPTTNP